MKKLLTVFVITLAFTSAAYARGMPPEILGKVRASIESRYPDNYSMQKILIDNQVQSYEYLQNYSPSSVPSNVLSRVKNKISSRYPYNFSMQKILIKNQVKSYLDLNR
jgi:phosphoenolpyruvate carboxylase